ncbi:MAG: peroxiredoxin [Methanomicrobiales archaeon]|nr:peroxiredoxin [Methanomicrobiales archaeon]
MVSSPDILTGSVAPSFSLPDHTGVTHSLEDYKNSWIILYFYPKDNTSACTAEALAFSAVYEELGESGVPVIGISPDNPSSHKKFIEKYDLKVTLLSDINHAVIESYGAWKLKKMYGKEYMGVERSTLLIDPSGTIQEIWRKVKVKGHVEEVLKKLSELKK